jgi:hypothetical protein
LLFGIAGSNPAGGKGCLLRMLCVVRHRSLRQAVHSSSGVLPSIVCLSVFEEPHRESLGPLGLSNRDSKISRIIGPVNRAKKSFSCFSFTLFPNDEMLISIDHVDNYAVKFLLGVF